MLLNKVEIELKSEWEWKSEEGTHTRAFNMPAVGTIQEAGTAFADVYREVFENRLFKIYLPTSFPKLQDSFKCSAFQRADLCQKKQPVQSLLSCLLSHIWLHWALYSCPGWVCPSGSSFSHLVLPLPNHGRSFRFHIWSSVIVYVHLFIWISQDLTTT